MLKIALKLSDVKTDAEASGGYSEKPDFYPEVSPISIHDDGKINYHIINSLLLSGQG